MIVFWLTGFFRLFVFFQEYFQQSYCLFNSAEPSICQFTSPERQWGSLVRPLPMTLFIVSIAIRSETEPAELITASIPECGWGKPASLINRHRLNASVRHMYFSQVRILFIPFQKLITTHFQNQPEPLF